MTEPGTLAQFRQQQARMFAAPRPPMTSVWDFETNYHALAWSTDATNYGWYQTRFAVRAAQVFQARGLEFVMRLREELPWGRFTEWTSEEPLGWLEQIEPGFAAWAASLEA